MMNNLHPADYEASRLVGYLGGSIKEAIAMLSGKRPNVELALNALHRAQAELAASDAAAAERRARLYERLAASEAKLREIANG